MAGQRHEYDPRNFRAVRSSFSIHDEGRKAVSELRAAFTPLTHKLFTLSSEEAYSGIVNPQVSGSPAVIMRYGERHEAFAPQIIPEELDLVDEYAYSDQFSFEAGRVCIVEICVPAGDYGSHIALATANSARALFHKVKMTMDNDCREVDKKYFGLLYHETHFKNATLTLLDGIQSLAGTYGLLIANRVEGFENPVDLFYELLENNMFSELSLRLPNGQTGPMLFGGYRFKKRPVEATTQGDKRTVKFTADFLAFLKRIKQRYVMEDNGRSSPGFRKLGCPVGHGGVMDTEEGQMLEDTGVNQVAKAMYPYLEYFYQNG